jgi:hypothetical protein
LVAATTGNEIVEGGHIHVQPNVEHKFIIPRLQVGQLLQKRVEMPQSIDSKGDFTIDEKILEPKDMMVYTEFNPRAYEHIWRPYQPTGNLVFRALPPNVQNAMLSEMAKQLKFEIGDSIINSKSGTGARDFFDGILRRIIVDTTVIRSSAAQAAITASTILDILQSIQTGIPKAIRRNPALKLFMSIEDADIYNVKLTQQQFKGANYTDRNPERYGGINIVPLAAWPKDVIACTYATSGMDSNFWMGVDYADDTEVVQIDKVANNGELYFFKMLMKMDTQTVWGKNIVYFDGRMNGSDPLNPNPTA